MTSCDLLCIPFSKFNSLEVPHFKQGGKLKMWERWYASDHKIEVVDEINYLGVTFDRAGDGINKNLR
jgi:hypothetical protein